MFELEKEWQTANDGFPAGFSFKEWLANRVFVLRDAVEQTRELDEYCTHKYSHDNQPADYEFCPWCGGKHRNR